MSELTFSCPSCGQHIQCEKAYGGHVIHCPNCCAELRIPFSNTALPTELTVPKAQLVLEPTGKPSAPAAPAGKTEILCVCPVCQSELRVPPASHSDTPPTAELVRPREPVHPPEPEPETPPEPDAPSPHKTQAEHEDEIAAARAARPIQANQPVKPRLSYILSTAQPPPESTPPSEPGKEPNAKPGDHKSFPE